ncbi:hypothetical protein GCM10025789_09570 [Tessaracoccus lubricantis]|uniref:DUF11 domain-containing protein n=1 Tax=Tessaracoccus lubricantis TaxID=545543 RepID=A0ABP9F5A3_9ACTN
MPWRSRTWRVVSTWSAFILVLPLMGVLGAQATETPAQDPAIAAMAAETPTATLTEVDPAAVTPTPEVSVSEQAAPVEEAPPAEPPAEEPIPTEVVEEPAPEPAPAPEPVVVEEPAVEEPAVEEPAPVPADPVVEQAEAPAPVNVAPPGELPALETETAPAAEALVEPLATENCTVDAVTPINWSGSPSFVYDACGNATDDMFTQGSKEDGSLEDWTHEFPSSGKSTDIVSAAVDVAYVGDDPILYFGFNRYSVEGDGAFYLELNQEPNTVNGNGTPIPNRTVGDLRFAFTTSTTEGFSAQPLVYEWDGDSWVLVTGIPSTAFTYAVSGDTVEFTFNLNALVGDGEEIECGRLGFNSLYLRSTASSSLDSSLKDFVTGPVDVDPCPSLEIKKLDMDDNLVGGATFEISPDPRDRSIDSVTITENGDGDDSDTLGIIRFDEAKNGEYTIEEVSAPDGYLLPLPADRVETITVGLTDDVSVSFHDPQVPTLSKTAVATYHETYVWEIVKMVDGEETVTHHVGDEPVVVGYDVEVSLVGVQRSGYSLTGVITVVNPDVAMKVSLSDELAPGMECTITGVAADTGNVNLAVGTNEFTYTCIGDGQLGDIPLSGTNTATLKVSEANWSTAFPDGTDDVTVTATQDYAFAGATASNQTVTVTDTFDGVTTQLGTVTANDAGTAVTAAATTGTVVTSGTTATFSYTRTLEGDPEADECQVYTNTARIVETQQSSDAEATVCVPDISLTKTASPTIYDAVGDVITYTFVSTNTGQSTLTDVTITDPLEGLSALVCMPAQPATLLPGESMTCTATYLITQDDLDSGSVYNLATTVGTPPEGEDVTDTDDETVTGQEFPAIQLLKSADVDSYDSVGDVITYTFVSTNTGNVTLTDVMITDPLEGLSELTCDLEAPVTLAPGESLTCTATYVVTQADLDDGSVDNVATTVGTPPEGEDVTDDDDETVPGEQLPAIDLLKTASPTIYDAVDDVITYTFVSTNTGNVTLTDVMITDPLEGLTELTCDLEAPVTLAPGESLTCTATYLITQDDLDSGSVYNLATTVGTPPEGEDVTDDDDETVTGEAFPVIELVKTADVDSYDSVGDVITYTFVSTNTGNVTLTDVMITDPLEGLTELTCDLEAPVTLAPGESLTCTATYVVTQADLDDGSVDNVATTVGTPPEGEDVTDDDDETVPGEQLPAIDLVKTADVESYDSVGDVITYTFVSTNTGNVTLTDVMITDPLEGLSELTCDLEAPVTLAPGESLTCTATYTVTQADLDDGSVDNVATTVGTPPEGEDVTDDDDETVPGEQLPAIELVKTADRAEYAEVGEIITYTLVATNTGNVTLTDVVIDDERFDVEDALCAESLAPGEECAIELKYEVTQDDIDARSIVNVAMVEGTAPNGETVTDEDDALVEGPIPAGPELTPGIQLIKHADKAGPVRQGDAIVYSFTVTNTGETVLTDVRVDDPKLAAAGISVTCPVTELDPGESTTCTASAAYVVTAADVAAGKVLNLATATGETPEGEPVTDQDDHQVPTEPTPVVRPPAQPKPIVRSGDPTGGGIDTGSVLTGVALLVLAGGAAAMAGTRRRRS